MTDRISGNGQPDGLPPRGTGRRRSLIFLVFLLLALPLAFLIRATTDQGWRAAATVEALGRSEVVYIPAVRVFLVDASPPIALRGLSTHLGEPVAYCRSAAVFLELAHGSMWDRTGLYLTGPAPRGLDRVASRVVDGVIQIRVGDVTRGPPRGTGEPEQPTGALCVYEEPQDATNGFLEPPPVAA